MAAETQSDATWTVNKIQDEAYARLRISEFASLSQITTAIRRREESRLSFNANSPSDVREADAIYEASLTKGIKNELEYCLEYSKHSPLEALQTLSEHLRPVQDVPLSEDSLKKLDQLFLDIALETMVDEEASAIEKAASVTLALQFGVEKLGSAKTENILEQRLAAEQAARMSHINKASRQEALNRLEAFNGFFEFAGLEFESETIDSTLSAGAQKAADIAKHRIERGKQVLGDGAKFGQKAASVAVLASMGIAGGASVAAAETPTTSEAVAQAVVGANAQRTPEVSAAAVIDIAEVSGQAQSIEVPTTPIVEARGGVADVDASAIKTAPVVSTETPGTPTVDAAAGIAAVPEITEEQEAELAPAITPDSKEPTAPTYVEAAPTVEQPKPTEEATQEPAAPATIIAPNSDVNVAVGETPQEALSRIVASRDMNAASYALRKLYSGTPDQAPVNETLSALISGSVSSLSGSISEAAHADQAYTDKAYFALAYLDAVTRSPAMLDNPEVAAFVNGLSEQGEDYRNKLFAQYLAEAKAALSAEAAGSYDGVAEQYRGPIETLYAYTAMAGVSDAKQAEQIEAIKAEEARLAAEAEARRIAAEQAQQGLSPIEIIAADEKQLVLNGIERARQSGAITDRYANVARLVVEQEGPGALVAASGMIGNCMAEADGCNPDIVERGNGIGYGIFQWSFGRRGTLEQDARNKGVFVGDINFQVPYAIAESKARSQRDNRSLNEWQGMMEQTDPAAAAEFWRWNFERPNEHLSHTSTRLKVAQEVHAAITGQIDAIRNEAAAAKTAREAELARQEAERQRQAEEARRTAEAQGDIRSQLTNGLELLAHFKQKYNDISGQLDDSELHSFPALTKYGEPMTMKLNPEAHKGFEALAAAYRAQFGEDIRITDHYRDLDSQHAVKKQKGKYAATPGKSLHGWGLAIDFASNINAEGSPQHEWMEANAHKYGWTNPTWAHDGKGIEEPWHWEFTGNQATFEENN